MTEIKDEVELAKKIVKEVHRVLGLKNSNTKDTTPTQARAAIAMSLTEYFPKPLISIAIKRDRTCVYHYIKKHADNMKYWKGYERVYEIAQAITGLFCSAKDERLQIESICRYIEVLEERKEDLKKSLSKKEELYYDTHETTKQYP